FVGIAAANSFGPVMRFAYGAGFASRTLTHTILKSLPEDSISIPVPSMASGIEDAQAVGEEPRCAPRIHERFSFGIGIRMKRETIAIHVGYDGDPATKAVAVPIYQTIAFEFDSAEHGAALFNLEVEGNIYTRIGNPTNTVLEGGVDALSVSSGMAAIEYSIINIAEMGNNIVSLPQLYGATYTLFAHVFAKRGITARFSESDCPNAVEKLIDENTRAVFCESIGNPAGNVADIEGLARVAH